MINNIILAIIQAITELLPISSSGHLLIVSNLFNIKINDFQLLMTFLHFWTALAIIAYYFKDLIKLTQSKAGWIKIGFLGIATIPAALFGVLFDKSIEAFFYTLIVIAINSIIWGIIMIVIEKLYNLGKFKQFNIKESWQIIIMGIAQTLALIPGTSRSGITTLTGIVLGKDKGESLNLSFLLGIPITLGPFILESYKSRSELHNFLTIEMLFSGIITFVLGYIAILLLNKIKEKNFMTYFGTYRIVLGIILVFVILLF